MLSLEQLTQTPEFQELRDTEKMFVATYVSNGQKEVQAIRTAYNCADDGIAKRMSYRIMGHVRIQMALCKWREELPKDVYLRLLRKASRNRTLSKPQLECLRLYAEVGGFLGEKPRTPRKPEKQKEAKKIKRKLQNKISPQIEQNIYVKELNSYENSERNCNES